jgi:NADPH:quinone reductase-like Zn-dependent oxidoreductase
MFLMTLLIATCFLAEYVNVNERMLIRKPEELSFEQTGGLCEVSAWVYAWDEFFASARFKNVTGDANKYTGTTQTWFTAIQALHFVGQYSSQTTKSILWHAGASAVSVAGIQLSRDANLIDSPSSSPPLVFATTRKQDKCDFVIRELGASGAVDLSQYPDKRKWATEVKALNEGRGIDLVVDFLGGPYLESNLEVLAIDGRVVQLGWLDGPIAPADANIAAFLAKRACVQGSQLRSRSLEYQVTLRDFFVANVLPGLVQGRFKHIVERVLPWSRVKDAHELLESKKTKGKVVCVIE